MNEKSAEFLRSLLNAPGPSGVESGPARIWREEATRFAETVTADVLGNSFATLRGDPG